MAHKIFKVGHHVSAATNAEEDVGGPWAVGVETTTRSVTWAKLESRRTVPWRGDRSCHGWNARVPRAPHEYSPRLRHSAHCGEAHSNHGSWEGQRHSRSCAWCSQGSGAGVSDARTWVSNLGKKISVCGAHFRPSAVEPGLRGL